MSKRVVRVEIEYDDGEVRRAEGVDASIIWDAYTNALEFYCVKNRRDYEGPVMRPVAGHSSLPLLGEAQAGRDEG